MEDKIKITPGELMEYPYFVDSETMKRISKPTTTKEELNQMYERTKEHLPDNLLRKDR